MHLKLDLTYWWVKDTVIVQIQGLEGAISIPKIIEVN